MKELKGTNWVRGIVCLLGFVFAISNASAAVVENVAETLPEVKVNPLWAQIPNGGSVVGDSITGGLTFIRSDFGVDGANDWLVEAVLKSDAPTGAGEAGARIWVQARTDLCMVDTAQAQWIIVHLERDAGTGRFVRIYDELGNLKNQTAAAGGGPAEINLTAAATPAGWEQEPPTGPFFRIRLMRQGNIIHLQAEPSGSFAANPTYPDVEVDLTLANFPPIPNGAAIINIAQVGFGNALSVSADNHDSTWEQIHVTSTDGMQALPYWPPQPPAPTLVHDDMGAGNPQGIDFSADFSGSGYLTNDTVTPELDADGTTYVGEARTNPGVETWYFDNLNENQLVFGRIIATEVSGRSQTGSDGIAAIPSPPPHWIVSDFHTLCTTPTDCTPTRAIELDPQGNLYIENTTDDDSGQVDILKLDASSGYATSSIFASYITGYQGVTGLDFNGLGGLYVSERSVDGDAGIIRVIDVATQTLLGDVMDFSNHRPTGVDADSFSNTYYSGRKESDKLWGKVFQIDSSLIRTELNASIVATGIALDTFGNIFISTPKRTDLPLFNNSIYMFRSSDVDLLNPILVASFIQRGEELTFDDDGNLYMIAEDQVSIYKLAPADGDTDGVLDYMDNCTLGYNPSQRDTDGDGYGNICDADLNNDGAVNFADLGLLKAVFFTADPDADFNGDGAVNFADLGLLKSMFFQPPGPSGLVP